jgi:hypothetical protein
LTHFSIQKRGTSISAGGIGPPRYEGISCCTTA